MSADTLLKVRQSLSRFSCMSLYPAVHAVSLADSQNVGRAADNIHRAILDVIAEGKYRTGDLGGRSRCSEFTKAIIGHLQ